MSKKVEGATVGNQVIGADIGNYATEITGSDFEHLQVTTIGFSSTVFEPTDEVREKAVNKLMNNLKVHVKSDDNNIDGYYYIGEAALRNGIKTRVMNIEVIEKSNNDIPVIMLLSLIAANQIQKTFKSGKDLEKTEINVDLVTAIPASEFTVQRAKTLEGRLLGTHTVTVYYADTKTVVDVTFKNVKVTEEGKTAMLYLSKLDPKVFTKYVERYKKLLNITDETYSLHFDIGNGTMEITFMKGLNPIASAGFDKGIGHAIEDAIKLYQERIPVKIDRQSFNDILQSNSPKGAFAEECLSKSLNQLKIEVLEQIKTNVSNLTKGQMDLMFMHGGGSIMLESTIIKELYTYVEEMMAELVYVDEEYAPHLNARGCYELAKLLFGVKVGA